VCGFEVTEEFGEAALSISGILALVNACQNGSKASSMVQPAWPATMAWVFSVHFPLYCCSVLLSLLTLPSLLSESLDPYAWREERLCRLFRLSFLDRFSARFSARLSARFWRRFRLARSSSPDDSWSVAVGSLPFACCAARSLPGSLPFAAPSPGAWP
jgi:hypothetical protein